MAELTRREGLGLALAAGGAAAVAPAARASVPGPPLVTRVDFADPKWNRDTFARLDMDVDPSKTKVGWLKGVVYGVRDNEAVRPLFANLSGVEQACPADEQLMWLSDVRYADDAALAIFAADPDAEVRGQLLGDIDLIVDQSTTYKALDADAVTLVDTSTMIPPQGPPRTPAYGLFFRARGEQAAFRTAMTALAERWSTVDGVLRLRLSLLEAPDVAAERAAGYPIKTHPPERQYQAWIDLALANDAVTLPIDDVAEQVRAVHAYPIAANYTSNYAGKPTFVGLRGFPAWDALTAIGGYNQAQEPIMRWMYGDVADGVKLEPVTR